MVNAKRLPALCCTYKSSVCLFPLWVAGVAWEFTDSGYSGFWVSILEVEVTVIFGPSPRLAFARSSGLGSDQVSQP